MRKSKTRRIRRKRKTKINQINQIKPIKNQNHPKIKIKTPRSRPTKKNPRKGKTSKKKKSLVLTHRNQAPLLK